MLLSSFWSCQDAWRPLAVAASLQSLPLLSYGLLLVCLLFLLIRTPLIGLRATLIQHGIIFTD